MNYYKNNTLEKDYQKVYAPLVSVLLNNRQFSDKAHDSLMRCAECGVKYDMHDLTRINVGYYVCKFCLRKGM